MIGIVDVGGGMRGIYGAGVFDWCIKNNVFFDCVVGVSAGSANGIAYAAGHYERNYEFYNNYSFRKEYMSVHNFLTTGSYLDFDYIYGTLSNEGGENPLDYDALMASPIDLEIVATDAHSGHPVYLPKKHIERNNYVFLKMSSCIPIINKPYPYLNREFFDGGLSDPIPFQRAFEKGCDQVVIILTRPKDYVRSGEKDQALSNLLNKTYHGAKEGLKHRSERYNAQLEEAKKYEAEGRVLIIAPDDISGLKTLSLDHQALDQLYWKGRKDAEAISAFLKLG
ncbi:MAG: patatin family protein [Solobacterium sp.]|nr:patatin family protein [Solobacterium sp.]